MDPYQTLNVSRDATPEDIKKAYRNMAKNEHPDVGGNAEKFGALSRAYDVLSDTKKRARYDETGETETQSKEGMAVSIIGQIADALIMKACQSGRPETFDLVGSIKQQISHDIQNLSQQSSEAKRFKASAEKMLKRLSVKSGPDYLSKIVEAKIRACDNAISQSEERVELLKQAQEIVSVADYKFDEPPPKVWTNSFGPISTGSW